MEEKKKDQKSTIRNIKTLSKLQEKVFSLFDDYSRVVSEAQWSKDYQ